MLAPRCAVRLDRCDHLRRARATHYSIIASVYQDGWAAASSAGTAKSYNGTGATHGASRFDYVFFSKASALVLQSVTVPDARVKGVQASDHDPVVAVFTVK